MVENYSNSHVSPAPGKFALHNYSCSHIFDSGNSFLCSDDGLYIFVSNLINGIDQYRFPSLEKIQSFLHVIENNYPLQVSSAAKGSLVVCGGDNGFARVFDRRTGQLIQRLEHLKCKSRALSLILKLNAI